MNRMYNNEDFTCAKLLMIQGLCERPVFHIPSTQFFFKFSSFFSFYLPFDKGKTSLYLQNYQLQQLNIKSITTRKKPLELLWQMSGKKFSCSLHICIGYLQENHILKKTTAICIYTTSRPSDPDEVDVVSAEYTCGIQQFKSCRIWCTACSMTFVWCHVM